MRTLRERVERLENEMEKLSVDCFKQAAAHAYDALQPSWDKIDAMSDRLMRIERIAEETRADVSVLKRQMTVVTVRFDRIDSEIGRLDRRIDGLSERVDTLTDRMDGLTSRVDGLNERVDALTGRMDGLTSRVDTLTERVDGLTTRVDSLTDRMDGLTTQVDTLTERVDGLSERVGTLTERVDGLGESMSALTEQVNAVSRQVDTMAGTNAAMFKLILDRLDSLSATARPTDQRELPKTEIDANPTRRSV
ncbi:hypothetical protein [Microbispora rosea]|nr:hypothetical protein [Microbispora rosea]GIH48143.1 hypothetical protein Mro03_33220 [Microbispora rosea subsp. rosea]